MTEPPSSRPILVVDDDPDIREAVREVLEFDGHEVVLKANGREALDALPHLPEPCLVLLDMMMPVMDGAAFLQHFRRIPAYNTIPVILCTASIHAPPPGAQGLLGKPFELDALLALIQEHCR
jgi:CheY-like chemotaxis protein